MFDIKKEIDWFKDTILERNEDELENEVYKEQKELTEEQLVKLHFLKDNILDLEYEQKIKLLDFIEKERISIIIQ